MSTKPGRSVGPTRADEGPTTDVASFLSLGQASEYLGVAPSFVRRLVYERRITYYKLGRYLRFNPADLDEYVLTTRVDTFAQQPWVPELTTPAPIGPLRSGSGVTSPRMDRRPSPPGLRDRSSPRHRGDQTIG